MAPPESRADQGQDGQGRVPPRPAAEGPGETELDLGEYNRHDAVISRAIDDDAADNQASRLRETICVQEPPVFSSGADPDRRIEPGMVIADRYRVLGEIARGGMGIVLKVHDIHIGRTCAMKLLRRSHTNNSILVRRFEWEARLNALLEHPGTVPMHDMNLLHPEFQFFTMLLVDGHTLEKLLSGRPSLEDDLPRLLRVYHRVCETVAYAHSHRIVHRDLKPQNIMVGNYGVVKVMDWGLAKMLNQETFDFPQLVHEAEDGECNFEADPKFAGPPDTQHGTVFGTLSYAPPEQVRGRNKDVDERSDVFALGGVLCEILTGSPTYRARRLSSLYKKAMNADVQDAFDRLAECTADRPLVEIALRCLQVSPQDRPADAGEMTAAIAAYLESDLRRAERDQGRFFNLTLDLFCIAGFNGYFRRVNVNFSRVLGYSECELLARPFHEFVHPADLSATAAAVEQLESGQPVVRFTNRYRHQNGHYVTLEWAARPEPDEGVIYAVAREVTETSGSSGWSLVVPGSQP